jgi:hypothetical protein
MAKHFTIEKLKPSLVKVSIFRDDKMVFEFGYNPKNEQQIKTARNQVASYGGDITHNGNSYAFSELLALFTI